jgi:hypothetical protein
LDVLERSPVVKAEDSHEFKSKCYELDGMSAIRMKKKIVRQLEKANYIFRSIQLLAVPILKDLGTIKATTWMWLAPNLSITVGV